MPQTKTMWRRVLLGARSALAPAVRARHSATIAARVQAHPAFAGGGMVLAYEPIGAEVDPTPLCTLARDLGRAVFVPARDRSMRWERWRADDDAPASSADEADAESPFHPADDAPLLVLVPGIGFDVTASRLGRGAGFYDRALAALRETRPIVAVGLAFEAQIVPRLPTDPWDQPVDLIATEERVITASTVTDSPARRDAEEVSDS